MIEDYSSGIFPIVSGKVTDLLSRLGETQETFTGIILFMSMFNDISCEKKDNEEECLANAKVVSLYAKKFGIGQWIGPVLRRSGILWKRVNLGPYRGKDAVGIRRKWMSNFPCNDSLSRVSQKQRTRKTVDFAADLETIETIFRISFCKSAQSRSSRGDM